MEWSEEKIYSWVQKEVRRSGISVSFIPPDRGSERFVACGECGEHVSSWQRDPHAGRPCHSACVDMTLT